MKILDYFKKKKNLPQRSLEDIKRITKILFIDDIKFETVDRILKSVLVRDFENEFNGTKIHIPVKGGVPDFAHMETFIRAIQKLVIKDLAEWVNKNTPAKKQEYFSPNIGQEYAMAAEDTFEYKSKK